MKEIISELDGLPELLSHFRVSDVAEGTGLHYMTVYKIANGKTKGPSHDAVQRILAWAHIQQSTISGILEREKSRPFSEVAMELIDNG